MKDYKEDLVGRKYGDLVVTSFLHRKRLNKGNQTTPVWFCMCKCGNFRAVVEAKLKNGTTISCTSCGLARTKRVNSEGRTGVAASVKFERLYRIWGAMKQRCSNPKNVSYMNYGGKGITVCEEWKTSYKSFREWALASNYQDDLTIDRKIHTLGYSPENCRWVTLSENSTEMCKRHREQGTGGFSEESFVKIRVTNKSNLGKKFSMYLNCEFVSKWECLIDCAEYICNVKGLKTKPSQIKKNISACLHNKRASCHGYTFKLEEF